MRFTESFFVKYGCLCTHNVQNGRCTESFFVIYGCLCTHDVQNGRSTEILSKVWVHGYPRRKNWLGTHDVRTDFSDNVWWRLNSWRNNSLTPVVNCHIFLNHSIVKNHITVPRNKTTNICRSILTTNSTRILQVSKFVIQLTNKKYSMHSPIPYTQHH